MIGTTLSTKELVGVAESLAQEKSINVEQVIDALKAGFLQIALANYGNELDISIDFDLEGGELSISCKKIIVKDGQVLDVSKEISVSDAKRMGSNAKEGEELIVPLPPLELSGSDIMLAKRHIMLNVRGAERKELCARYESRVGQVVTGFVKRTEQKGVLVDVNNDELFLPRENMIPRESFRQKDRVKLYVEGIKKPDPETGKGQYQVVFSRKHPQFLSALFEQEVPEIYDKVVEIKGVAWDPGSRAKIAVFSRDPSVDPVGACVGFGGSRVKAVIEELRGEKIDIISWSEDPVLFVTKALAPVEITNVFVQDDNNTLEVVVPDGQVSLAIGRGGQNVELASELVGWHICIKGEEESSNIKKEEFETKTKTFAKALDVDDVIAQLLIVEGFNDLESLSRVSVEDLEEIEAFDENLAKEILQRAQAHVEEDRKTTQTLLEKLKVSDELREFDRLLKPKVLIKLGENDVKTVSDLADLSVADLTSPDYGLLKDFALPRRDIERLIMRARKSSGWFGEQQEDPIGEAGA